MFNRTIWLIAVIAVGNVGCCGTPFDLGRQFSANSPANSGYSGGNAPAAAGFPPAASQPPCDCKPIDAVPATFGAPR
jgi:hypothetical protein